MGRPEMQEIAARRAKAAREEQAYREAAPQRDAAAAAAMETFMAGKVKTQQKVIMRDPKWVEADKAGRMILGLPPIDYEDGGDQ